MASTESSISRIRVVRRKYRWPATQLNVWLFVVMVASSVVMGVFASFAAVQTQLLLGTPWYVWFFSWRGGGEGRVFEFKATRER